MLKYKFQEGNRSLAQKNNETEAAKRKISDLSAHISSLKNQIQALQVGRF